MSFSSRLLSFLKLKEKIKIKMKSNKRNLILILMCLSIVCKITQTSQLFGLKKNFKISFDKLIFNALNFLQKKLANGLFTNEDLFLLNMLTKFVLQKKELLERERKKQQTVYWLSRQGR